MKKINEFKKQPPTLWIVIGIFAILIIILVILLVKKGVASNVQSTIIGCVVVLFFTIRDKIIHKSLQLPPLFWLVAIGATAVMIISSILFNLQLIDFTVQTIILIVSIFINCLIQGYLIEKRD